MTSLLSLLGRGALAGGAAGVLSGGFSYLLAAPVLDRAVRLEAAREEASGASAAAEVFSRSTQHAGLLVATVVTGAALGVLFAVVYAILHRRDPDSETARPYWFGASGCFRPPPWVCCGPDSPWASGSSGWGRRVPGAGRVCPPRSRLPPCDAPRRCGPGRHHPLSWMLTWAFKHAGSF